MLLLGWLVLAVSWCVWAYPFIFLAPHNQKRPSITAIGPTRVGLFLESLAIFLAFAFRMPADPSPEWWRIVCAAVCGVSGVVLAWTDHINFPNTGTYQVYLGICYSSHDACKTGGAPWTRLSSSITVTIQ